MEELLRKLLLSGVAVLMDVSTPIQVTLAVMVCGYESLYQYLHRDVQLSYCNDSVGVTASVRRQTAKPQTGACVPAVR